METIKLQHPIEFEGRTLEEIEIRRPKVSDVTNAKKNKKDESEQEIALIAKLAGMPETAILDLDLADYKAIQEVLQGFFG